MIEKVNYEHYMNTAMNGKRTVAGFLVFELAEVENYDNNPVKTYYLLEKVSEDFRYSDEDNFYKLDKKEFQKTKRIFAQGKSLLIINRIHEIQNNQNSEEGINV